LSTDRSALTIPAAIPDGIANLDETLVPDFNLPVSPGIGNAGSLLRSLVHGQPENSPAPPSFQPPAIPPPPPPPAPVEAKPVRIGTMEKADLIHQVSPVYPRLARQSLVQGIVVLEAVIGTDGTIRNLRVVSGHPLLTGAALDAVKQWKYKPTILSGEAVEVATTITVNFTFQ
jgi:protein TonB